MAKRVSASNGPDDPPHVLIIVQNLPVPLDRRVWLECNALIAAGYAVSVICPKGPSDPRYAEIDGVRIYKYAPPPATSGALSYLVEFVYSWIRTALLSVRIRFRGPIDIIQACNPPDTYWALALIYKAFGARFVYDQHDLNPEVFLSRFGQPRGFAARFQYRVLVWLERRTYRTADHVITTNESYKAIARRRGGLHAENVTVVRSGPDTSKMRPAKADPALRRGRKLLVYLGIMGPQDGVDIVLRAADILINRQGRTDVQVALLGFGDCLEDLRRLAGDLRLDEYVTFTGRVGPAEISRYLSSADIGLSPDPLNPLNDVSTMNKTMEYMSFALPVVTFDLAETRVSAGTAAVYVEPARDGDEDASVLRFAEAIGELLDNPARRGEMGLLGRRRAEQVLDWAPQRSAYVDVFNRLAGRPSSPPVEVARVAAISDGEIDVNDDEAVSRFARTRGLA